MKLVCCCWGGVGIQSIYLTSSTPDEQVGFAENSKKKQEKKGEGGEKESTKS